MKIKLSQIRSNPFRDFDLYPIDEEQVRRLQQSIDSLGFFSGVTARLKNGAANIYELAAGHHRVRAADQAGLKEVEAVVDTYTDQEMVEIMTVENLTQKGHNAASVLDSVAAHCRIIAKEVLLGEGPTAKILAADHQLAQNQAKIAQHGPGVLLLYRAMNKFSKEDRKANKQAENITSTEIEQALATLKNGGVMGRIMADVLEEVQALRAERDAAAAAALAAKAEEETAKQKAKREAAEKAEQERREEEEERIREQQEFEAIYNPACAHIFRLTSHEKAFREAVLSDTGRRFISKGKQLALAKQIRKEIDAVEEKSSRDLGSVTIHSMIEAHLSRLIGIQSDIDKREKEELLRANAQRRVEKLWTNLRRGAMQAESALAQLVNEQAKWPYDDALFPMHTDEIDRVIEIGTRMKALKKTLGY